MQIDSHHHFWRYNPREYGWISQSMSVLRRDFLPADLRTASAEVGVEGVISVQARQTLDETRWLLKLADQNDYIRGIVGWAPLTSQNVAGELETLTPNEKLKAVRHVLQDEPDDYMLRDDFNRGIDALEPFGLRYDILIFERQLPRAIELVDRHPRQIFVLDHIAKPRIYEGAISDWREHLGELARRPNVYCKLSGVATEADHQTWTERQLLPYMETALEAFSANRLMFGSDWPVCFLALSYQRWYQIVNDFASRLSPTERDRLMGATAAEAYGIGEIQHGNRRPLRPSGQGATGGVR